VVNKRSASFIFSTWILYAFCFWMMCDNEPRECGDRLAKDLNSNPPGNLGLGEYLTAYKNQLSREFTYSADIV
jgi:hypothetical protein